MKLSIWRNINKLPKSKEDKISMAKMTSGTNIPEVVCINTEDDLMHNICSFAWSPSIFQGSRSNANFISTDFIVLDIDSGLTIAESEQRIRSHGLACLCLPSPSFTMENQKHRLVFPLAKTILNSIDFEATLKFMFELFPEGDPSCVDPARWYCMSKMEDGFWQDGDFLVPKKAPEQILNQVYNETQVEVPDSIKDIVKLLYGKERSMVPEAVSFFLENAHTGLSGMWINALNSCVFSLSLSGIDDTIIEDVIAKIAPSELDKRDLYQINRSIRDGKKARKELV